MDFNDFACGLVAGWSQILFGQPFDFVKLKFQTSIQKGSIHNFVKEIHSQHGLLGFYRGSFSLVLGFGPIIATEFFVLEASKRLLLKLKGHETNKFSQLSLFDIAIAGSIVGMTTAFIYCPIQYSKIQKQYHGNISESSLKILFRQFYQNGIKNLSKGLSATLGRQTLGSAIYYSYYEASMRYFTNNNREKATLKQTIISGGSSGIAYWIFSYPLDMIKTKVQLGESYSSIIRKIHTIAYRGFLPMAIRSFLVNASNFTVYEHCQSILNDSYRS